MVPMTINRNNIITLSHNATLTFNPWHWKVKSAKGSIDNDVCSKILEKYAQSILRFRAPSKKGNLDGNV